MMVEEQAKFATDLAKLILYINSQEYTLSLGEVWRTQYQQDHYVATGLSKTKHSKHQDRIAVDLNIFKNGKLIFKNGKLIICPKEIGTYWKSLSNANVWGGDWKSPYDPGHFERDIDK